MKARLNRSETGLKWRPIRRKTGAAMRGVILNLGLTVSDYMPAALFMAVIEAYSTISQMISIYPGIPG